MTRKEVDAAALAVVRTGLLSGDIDVDERALELVNRSLRTASIFRVVFVLMVGFELWGMIRDVGFIPIVGLPTLCGIGLIVLLSRGINLNRTRRSRLAEVMNVTQ